MYIERGKEINGVRTCSNSPNAKNDTSRGDKTCHYNKTLFIILWSPQCTWSSHERHACICVIFEMNGRTINDCAIDGVNACHE